MIEKLERIIEQSYHDGLPIGTSISRPPDNREPMDKINELVDWANGVEFAHQLRQDYVKGQKQKAND